MTLIQKYARTFTDPRDPAGFTTTVPGAYPPSHYSTPLTSVDLLSGGCLDLVFTLQLTPQNFVINTDFPGTKFITTGTYALSGSLQCGEGGTGIRLADNLCIALKNKLAWKYMWDPLGRPFFNTATATIFTGAGTEMDAFNKWATGFVNESFVGDEIFM